MAGSLVSNILLLLTILNLCSFNNANSPGFALAESPQVESQKPIVDDSDLKLQDAHRQTQKIWSELREAEPSWKESVIDTKSSNLATTMWRYVKIVFKTLFMNSPTRAVDTETPKLDAKLQDAVDILKASAASDPDALFLLAEMNFFGNFSYPRDFKKAFNLYSELADWNGNATAQYMVGLMYSTGLDNVIEPDQSRAQLYYTFAAMQGDTRAEMTVAHRYHTGIGTAKNCDKAVEYYKKVADKAMDWWQSGPPGGHRMQRNSWRWAESAGGAYGEGASVSSSGHLASDKNTIYESFDNVLEYLDMSARQGDWGATLALGKHFYEPPRGYRRNLRKAQRQFMKVARAYWTKDGKVNPKAPKSIDKTAAKAAAYIGRMFLRGEGMEQNFEKALTWFKRGVTNGDQFAQYHLGLMYRDGLGVPKDGTRAATYLKAAAEQSLAVAQSALGVLFLDQGDVDTAGRYFELAAYAGVMEGFYYLAELVNHGIGRQQNCHLAATWYKIVSEKAESLHSAVAEANSAYERGDLERAFIASVMNAEQGYENAQSNAAYLLDQKTSVLPLPYVPIFSHPLEPVPPHKRTKLLTNPGLAQVYFTRSAQQQNIDSLVKAGDYHFAGIGTRNVTTKQNSTIAHLEAASICYSTAAESHHAAQAYWNLGWMHENGIGPVEQDFHIAKRYYDLALEMNKEAYLPVKLSLLKLRVRSWWNGISGGKVKSIGEDDEDSDKEKPPKTFWEWLNRFLDAAEMDAQAEMAALQQHEHGHMGEDEAGDGLEAVAYGEPGMPGGDNEYYYGGRGEGEEDFYGDFDDGLIESLIIIALAGALAALVYARQQRQRDVRDRERRQQEQGAQGAAQQPAADNNAQQPPQQQPPGPGQNGGFFPNPGDPEFQNWVAGGIGH